MTRIERNYSRRNSIIAKVDPLTAEVVVIAWPTVTDEEIAEFLSKHKRWAKSAVERTKMLIAYKDKYDREDIVALHGKDYKVEYSKDRCVTHIEGDRLIMEDMGTLNGVCLRAWLGNYAEQYLKEMFTKYANDICKLEIKRSSRYYGQCRYNKDGTNTIILNPVLVHGDEDCIKYVIYHEMSHIKVHNHSKRFYEELAKYLPNHRALERHLKDTVHIVD